MRTPRSSGPWKVVVFDVPASDLCRPIEGRKAGEEVAGLPVCPSLQQQMIGFQGGGLFAATGKHPSTSLE